MEDTTTETWATILSAGTDFVTAQPIIMLLFAAGAVAGLIVMLAKRLAKGGR